MFKFKDSAGASVVFSQCVSLEFTLNNLLDAFAEFNYTQFLGFWSLCHKERVNKLSANNIHQTISSLAFQKYSLYIGVTPIVKGGNQA